MDIPCQQCICFAVCKDSVPMRTCGTPFKYSLMGHIQNELITKCSLLNDFIYFNDDQSNSGNNMYVIIDYFKSKMGYNYRKE